MEQLLNEREAAKLLQVSVQLLRKWRARGKDPRYIKLGRCVRYSAEEIERYILTQRSNPVAVHME